MDFFGTTLGVFLYNVILLVIFVGLLIAIIKSAMNSWKSTQRVTSMLDELVEGIIVIVIYATFASMGPTTVINALKGLVTFFYEMITGLLRSLLGLPI